MAEVKCDKCGKEFQSEHALKIHVGRAHGNKPKKSKARKKAKGRAKFAKAGPAGKFVCADCGRGFKLAMHLARHRAASHGLRRRTAKATRAAAPAGRRRRPGRPATTAGVNVSALSVDELLALKTAVEDRLSGIIRQMRQAKVKV